MELEIDFSIENILFVILFIYCIYLLFFSFSNPKQEGFSVSSGKKSKSKKSDGDEDGGDDGGDDNKDGDDDGGDDDKTYQTASPSDTKDDPDNGIAENSAHYAKTLKHTKENYLYNLKIPKYKDNYKKLVNKMNDNTDLFNLSVALEHGFILYGNKDELLNTIDKYS